MVEGLKDSNVIQINQPEIDSAKNFVTMIKNSEVTHGVIAYRTTSGDIKYKIFGEPNSGTYLCGMLHKVMRVL